MLMDAACVIVQYQWLCSFMSSSLINEKNSSITIPSAPLGCRKNREDKRKRLSPWISKWANTKELEFVSRMLRRVRELNAAYIYWELSIAGMPNKVFSDNPNWTTLAMAKKHNECRERSWWNFLSSTLNIFRRPFRASCLARKEFCTDDAKSDRPDELCTFHQNKLNGDKSFHLCEEESSVSSGNY